MLGGYVRAVIYCDRGLYFHILQHIYNHVVGYNTLTLYKHVLVSTTVYYTYLDIIPYTKL